MVCLVENVFLKQFTVQEPVLFDTLVEWLVSSLVIRSFAEVVSLLVTHKW